MSSQLPPQVPIPQPAGDQDAQPPPDAQQLMMAIAGNVHGGAAPMRPGGSIQQQYPGLRAMSRVDWRQVNPRLLESLDKEAQKRGVAIVLQSGYRDHQENDVVKGHPTSSHKRGTAVDAFIAGHPIGEVIGPDELAKMGIEVGGPKGDAAHVELMGIPLRKPPAAKEPQTPPTPQTPPLPQMGQP